MKPSQIYTLILTTLISSMLLLPSCSLKQQLKRADKKYRIGEYYAAASRYKKLASRIPSKNKQLRASVNYKLGNCYRLINDSRRAEGAYQKAIRYKVADSTVYLRYADVLLKNNKIRQAASNFRHFLRYDSLNVWAQNGLTACDSIKTWKREPQPYAVKKMDTFNSRKGTDFSPLVYDDEGATVYFCSSRIAKGVKGIKNSKITGIPNNNIYVIKQKHNGKWEEPASVSEDINSNFDEGTPALSPDGKTLYFTKCRYIPGSNLGAEIWASKRNAGEWDEAKPVTLIADSSVTVAHPALSPDGKYIYFVSDRIGGYGGKDIWRCELKGDNQYGDPENLGPDINTPGDEMFPTFDRKGILYFSSNGHPGFGGLDIFSARFTGKDSVNTYDHYKTQNMKMPVNSIGDDFSMNFIGRKNSGYFSSNRNDPKGRDKIYYFAVPEVTFAVTGKVLDFREEPLTDAIVRIIGDDGTNTKLHVKKDGSYSYPLKKGVNYVMLASCRGHLNQKSDFSTLNLYKNTGFTRDFSLPSMLQPVPIDNIFFDFARYTLRKESQEALSGLIKMLNDNPHVTIEISAHTDMVGSDEFNMDLSQERAQAVVDYLISAGIEEERLTSVGYGESAPVKVTKQMTVEHPFFNEGDVLTEEYVMKLNETQREIANQINRRTEFTVTRTTYKMY